ncbi:MAG: hypothetical protein BYD32DRAFT_450284 [Podila humilis]|nr:MAG: hypothetical protein BYD32DRAFT_450284 [Podila humilis]
MRRPTQLLSLTLLAVLSLQAMVAQGATRYRIKSMQGSNGNYVGVRPIKTVSQFIETDAPITDWGIEKVEGNKFRLRVGSYPNVGIRDNRVIASLEADDNVEWLVEHQEAQGGYTISSATQPYLGWTKSQEPESQRVDIKHILVRPSEPPQYLPNQLWHLESI